MQNHDEDITENSEKEIESSIKCTCKGKKTYAIIVIALIAGCAIGEHLYNKYNYSKFSKHSKKETIDTIESKSQKQNLEISLLREEIRDLKNQISLNNKITYQKNNLRNKWKVWINLKNKLMNQEDFENELEIVKTIFSEDKELLQLIDEATAGVDIISTEKQSTSIIDKCKKYIKKIVSFKKVDHKKIYEISGYILSSINTETPDE